jgi:hypothetical protein
MASSMIVAILVTSFVPVSVASAREARFTFDESFSLQSCTEVIDGSWTGRVNFHFDTDASGGLHVQIHFTVHGTAVGESTGDTYQLHVTLSDEQNVSGPPPYELNEVFRLTFVGQHTVLQEFEDMHVTVNANGDMTVSRLNPRLVCH